MRRKEENPYVRVGHCCGCRALRDLTLYRVPGVYFMYRCVRCFKKLVGYLP